MRIIAGAAAFSLIGGIAVAADMPPPRSAPIMPPAVAEIANWTGFYVGFNAGGGIGTADNDFNVAGGPTFASVDLPLKGGLGGGQIGYNWQSGAMVYGVEADFQGTSLKGSISTPCVPPFCGLPLTASYTEKLPWFGTVRGRLGYTQAGWLLYATGGYAYGRVETDATATAGPLTATLSTSETRSGWTVGGGAEVMLSPRWTFKVEYLFVDLGHATNSYIFTGLPTLNNATHVNVNVARAGVNFRF
jgi:outer membrane immunogenic protein